MYRKISITILAVLTLLLLVAIFGIRYFNNLWLKEKPLHLEYSFENSAINFEWVSQTFGEHVEPHAAIIIPVQLNGFAHKFYFQFDTGAHTSLLYGRTLQSLDTLGIPLSKTLIDDQVLIDSIDFLIGGNQFRVQNIAVLEGYGKAFNQEDTINGINLGTLGSDFLEQRITAIDFKNQKIRFYKERPTWMSEIAKFEAFGFEGRRLLLPCTIQDKNKTLLYDTGSSAFGLITSKDKYQRYSNNNIPEIKYEGKRWGQPLTIHHQTTDITLTTGNMSLPLSRVSYWDIYPSLQKYIMLLSTIDGFLGNKPFLEYILIFDTSGSPEFSILKNQGQDLLSL